MELNFLKSLGTGELLPEFKEIQRLSEEFATKVFNLLDSTQHRVTGEFSFGINRDANVEAVFTTFLKTVTSDFNSGVVIVEAEDSSSPITTRLISRAGHDELLIKHQCSPRILNAVFKLDKFRVYRAASKVLLIEVAQRIENIRHYDEKHYYRYALDVDGKNVIMAHLDTLERQDDKLVPFRESSVTGKTLLWFKVYLSPRVLDDGENVLEPTLLPIFEPEQFPIDPRPVGQMSLRSIG